MIDKPALSPSLITNPRMDRWVRFLPDRTARVATGKVEIGQGVVTALAQIAAEELDLPLDRVAVLSGDTDEGPDEVYTTSSLSIMNSGDAIRAACAEARALLIERAALRLNCAIDQIGVSDGTFIQDGTPSELDYWHLVDEIDWSREVAGTADLKPVADYRIVGTSAARRDLPGKLGGGGFIHDMKPDGDVLHARALRQPGRGAELTSLDEVAISRAAGGPIEILRVENFVAFLSPSETVAEAAAVATPAHAVWRNARDLDPISETATYLQCLPATDHTLGDEKTAPGSGERVEAVFSRPYVAHASMGPSCALALYDNDHLTVWSHGQGMHPLRKNLAEVLDIPAEAISAHHVDGPGCYGHNGADDAALDASLIAIRRPGQTIRLQWRREEEFGYEPVGPAMLVRLEVELDDKGRPVDWSTEIWSPTHVRRPGSGSGYLLAADALPNPPPAVEVTDPPEARGGGGTRNAVPPYSVGRQRTLHHLISAAPVRTSALRTLGGAANVFAIESLIDDLALRAGEDPLAYRLSITPDPRARAVIERAAAMANWQDRSPGGQGQGLGVGYSRYKNMAAHAAVIVALTVDEEVRLDQVWIACDAGLVINPDGVLNQLEGGSVQAISWALKEQVRLEGIGISSLDWESYPVLRFSEVPEMRAELIDASHEPSLGVGECTAGPTIAAIANAIAHALGQRLYDMPFSRERIMATLLADQ